MSSNAGALALREVEERCQILGRMAECFSDYRDPARVEHSLKRLLEQRIFGLCLGFEDLNDHDRLRDDPILCLAVGCGDIEEVERVCNRDKGHALPAPRRLIGWNCRSGEPPKIGTMAAKRKKLRMLLCAPG